MDRSDYSNERFRLWMAVAMSVLVHVVLVLLTVWAPITRRAAEPTPEESLITFSFAPVVEDAVEESSSGVVPLDGEARPPQPEPNLESSGLPSLEPPSERGEVLEALPPEPPAEEPEEQAEPRESKAEREVEELASESSSRLPEIDDGSVIRRDENALPTEREGVEGSPRQIHLDSAVRDFGRAVERAREARPPVPAGSVERNVFVPDPTSFPVSGVGIGNLVFESRDFDWSDYARQIYWEILRAWYRRIHRTMDEFEKWAFGNTWFLNHRNKIEFTIESNGQITGIELEATSGCLPLDESALDALAEVILPPLPEAFPRDQETIHATFIATGPIRGMKSHFDHLKRAGVF